MIEIRLLKKYPPFGPEDENAIVPYPNAGFALKPQYRSELGMNIQIDEDGNVIGGQKSYSEWKDVPIVEEEGD